MKLTVTQGNYAHFSPTDWILEGPLTVTSSNARQRTVTWSSGGTSLRATLNWNAATQVVGSFTIQFQGGNGSWYDWMTASSVNLTYSALTSTSSRALGRADVLDFRASGGNNQLFGGAGDDTIYGGSRNDNINGGTGKDIISAGGGNDILIGGAGADRLTGGAGIDRFRYMAASDGGDTITDFRRGTDRLEFSSTGFGGLARGALQASLFEERANAGAASSATVRFVFNRAQNTLFYDRDGRGGAAPVKIATLQGVSTISAGSIFIV
ncbi:calcium-binding protein [Novispirillum sp. DQ9]|uniref:calcium-binding protein n=1 Tax=Novispirillum sp. DQ9 TaxID=3398612 RepID=UPI003C7DF5BB